MNRLGQVFGLARRVPTVLRTLSHLEGAQARAQLHHMVFGLPKPRSAAGSPARLAIDAPRTPFLPPPAHVKTLALRRVELLGAPFDLGQAVDWETMEHGPLFAYHLHQHEYLRCSEWTAESRAALLQDWIENHRAGIGWDPHPISLRLLCWGRLLMTPDALPEDPSFREVMLASIADQVETLSQGLEVRLQANHLLSNLISVVFGGMLLDAGASRRWLGEADGLLDELDRQIRPDGGHEERSPMYHALLLENVLDLLNLSLGAPDRAPAGLVEGLRSVAARMLEALEVYTHADGRLALFADSAFDVAAEPQSLRDYAARLGLSVEGQGASVALAQTGYVRMRAGDFDLIASVAGPSPPHQPGHAHCDALAFELSVAGARLVTDTGLFEYRPGLRRDRARATASHSTLQIDAREQAELWAAHRIGGRPEVALTAWDASGTAEATCRGWSRKAPLHRRFYTVEASGVTILDRVEGRCREVRSVFPIEPSWRVELEARRAIARRASASSTPVEVEIELAEAFDWVVERGFYYPTFGQEVERSVLVGRGRRCEGAVTRFRRIA